MPTTPIPALPPARGAANPKGPFADGLIHLADEKPAKGSPRMTLCGYPVPGPLQPPPARAKGEPEPDQSLMPESVIGGEVAFWKECERAETSDHLQPCIDCQAKATERAIAFNARGLVKVPSRKR